LASLQEAELAREKTNGYKLDKSHIFAVNMFDDFERYMKVPDTWTPAEIKPYTPGVNLLALNSPKPYFLMLKFFEVSKFFMQHYFINYHIFLLQENLLKWLTDDKARDQFVIRAGTYTEVYWNDARKLSPELVFQKQVPVFVGFSSYHSSFSPISLWSATSLSKNNVYGLLLWHKNVSWYTYNLLHFCCQYWTDSFIQWSPLGTYLATVHRQGSQVWGGENGFERLMRFAHPQVRV
jgi:translation initiation factor 3 subunit B